MMHYAGGKGAAGVLQQIVNRMPRHKTYIETHTGSGKILLGKKPAEQNIAIEIDPETMAAFKRYSIGNYDDAISHILGDCVPFLKKYDFAGEELVYSDPPYVGDSRSCDRPYYKFEYTDEDHIRLIEVLDGLECFVMISGYPSKLYDDLLDDKKWRCFTFPAMSRGGVRTEALWCNFDPDAYIKHDYQYIGDGFRERERIKRKAQRFVSKLENLPADERNRILSDITENFGMEIATHF